MTPEHADALLRVIELVVLGVLLLGRWFERREGKEKNLTERVGRIERDAALLARADVVEELCDRIEKVNEAAVARDESEHVRVRKFIDDTHINLGVLQVSQARQGERVDTLQREMKEVRSKLFNPGGLALS